MTHTIVLQTCNNYTCVLLTGLSNYAFIEFYTTDDAVNWIEANKVESVTLKNTCT